ncbi:hypothetical protein F2P56_011195 [Juglans regia]|uniref:Uncharacterized protein n=2 Tax=Juglans regia TaxID=51240 RepID=A0A833XS69_JUGRE|nr:uncharacterized protein LOC108980578 [Juglans regia]KAF5470698.1 hypothetical protein F2P56_011195 [Juglans regia]
MASFRDAFEGSRLFDLGWRFDKYTWSKKHENETFTKERLDRAGINVRWKCIFQEGWVEVLAARSSDHRPLLCMNQKGNEERRGRKLFKYEARWALEEECVVALKKVWYKRMMEDGTPKNLQDSLTNSKRVFIKWCRKNGEDRGRELKQKTQLLKMLQENENRHNSGEVKRIQQEIGLLLKKEDLKLRQMAKVNWNQPSPATARHVRQVKRKKLRENCVKANWDAAIDQRKRRMGVGIVIRDEKGEVLAAICV